MFFLDSYISKGLAKTNGFDGELDTWYDIYSGNLNADCWIRGSSKAFVQYSPQIIEEGLSMSTYNIGLNGLPYDMQKYRYDEALKFNKKPSFIIYSVDAFFFIHSNSLYGKDQVLPFMFLNMSLEKVTRSMDDYNFYDFIIPSWRFIGRPKAVLDGIEHHSLPINYFRDRGYMGVDAVWGDDLFRVQKNIDHYTTEINPINVEAFEQFIIDVKKDSIKLVLVYPPEYIDGQKFIQNRSDVIKIYSSLSQKYEIPFLDYSNDSMSFDKNYFYNSMHLNRVGSELFSHKLVADIKILK